MPSPPHSNQQSRWLAPTKLLACPDPGSSEHPSLQLKADALTDWVNLIVPSEEPHQGTGPK